MKKYALHGIDLRYGMAAPKIYLKIGKMVIMWWGRRNGGLEVRWRNKRK